GLFSHRYLEQLPCGVEGDDAIPAVLEPGRVAVFSIPTDAQALWIPIAKAFGKGPSFLWIWSTRGLVYLGDERYIKKRLPKPLRSEFSVAVRRRDMCI